MDKFMKIHRLIIFVIIVLSPILCVSAKNKPDKRKYLSQKFILKQNLIFFDSDQFEDGEKYPQIFSNEIIWTKSGGMNAYSGKILNRKAKVEITDLTEINEFIKVAFKAEFGNATEIFQVYISKKSEKEFSKIFETTFVKSDFENPLYTKKCGDSRIKTKEHLFQCYGYPLSIEQNTFDDGKIEEKFFYICEFVGNCGGFDGYWIKLTKTGIDVAGYI